MADYLARYLNYKCQQLSTRCLPGVIALVPYLSKVITSLNIGESYNLHYLYQPRLTLPDSAHAGCCCFRSSGRPGVLLEASSYAPQGSRSCLGFSQTPVLDSVSISERVHPVRSGFGYTWTLITPRMTLVPVG